MSEISWVFQYFVWFSLTFPEIILPDDMHDALLRNEIICRGGISNPRVKLLQLYFSSFRLRSPRHEVARNFFPKEQSGFVEAKRAYVDSTILTIKYAFSHFSWHFLSEISVWICVDTLFYTQKDVSFIIFKFYHFTKVISFHLREKSHIKS